MFPDDLSTLTYEDIVAIVERLEFEPGPVDFKEVLNPSAGPGRAEAIQSFRRTVCAMANSAGGWIIFGVKDRAAGLPSQDRVIGIPLGGDLRRQFGDKLVGIVPEVGFDASSTPIEIPGSAGRGVFVARVPLSVRRPHQVTETGVFYRRGDGGAAVPMGYYEVRDQLLLAEERVRKLELLRLEITMHRVIVQMIRNIRPHPIQAAMRFDTTTIKALLPDVVPLLPYDSALIESLTSVPIVAGIANHLLDNSSDPALLTFSHRDQYLAEIESNLLTTLQQVDQFCDGVGRRFDELFGPSPVVTMRIPAPNPDPPAPWPG